MHEYKERAKEERLQRSQKPTFESRSIYWIEYDKEIPFVFLITSPERDDAPAFLNINLDANVH